MKKSKRPIKIITLDTETYDGLRGALKRIAIYDGKQVFYGYSFDDVDVYLRRYALAFDVHIYIHNMEFDLRKIPVVFHPDNVKWPESMIINGKLVTLKNVLYTFHDSFRILPNALSKLSKDFDVAHGKLDLWKAVKDRYPGEYEDLVDFLDRCHIDDPLFLEYLGYDVISLYEVIEKLLGVSGLSLEDFVKCSTTASLSRYIFKHGYKGQIFKHEDDIRTDYEILCSYKWTKDLELEDFIRCSYCGGRTEVFIPRLDKKGFHYDVNSLYPYVMHEFNFPVGKPVFYNTPHESKKMWERWLKNRLGLGFLECKIYVPPQPIPPLPVKKGKLTFPTGYIFGVWTYPELLYAVEECGVVIEEIASCCHFPKVFPVFEKFIDVFSKMKEQASIEKNESLRNFSKLLQNVGYGYTGMTRDKSKLDSFYNIEKYDEIMFADLELGFIEVPADVKSEYIQVQVASYVTSYARVHLLKAMLAVLKSGGQVYYCDTDSVVSSIPFPAEIVDKYRLGAWDLEGVPIRAIFLQPKVYVEVYIDKETNVKFKGISKDTQKSLEYDDYQLLYEELVEKKKSFRIVEKNKLMLRSIVYLTKKKADYASYEYRDKKINYKTREKRFIDYAENYTRAHHFDSYEDFEDFQYKKPKEEVKY